MHPPSIPGPLPASPVARFGLACLFGAFLPAIAIAQTPQEGPGAREARSSGFLVDGPPLFEALHADPRWPHFGAAYQYYSGASGLRQVAAVSLGETLSVYRDVGQSSRWEVGLQAGVFAIFDLDAASNDLVNADYRIAPTLAYGRDRFAAQLRLYHQSSHLGDEFVLRTSLARVNLSYEVVDLLLSYDLVEELRLYAGGGRVVNSEPELEPWLFQGGLEFGFGRNGGLRPVGALDLQAREEHDWHLDYCIRAGIELDNATVGNRRIQLMLEYYHGRSPNGQFYVDDVEFVGIGFHFYF